MSEIHDLEAGIRRVRAPNPSPMTERGTNTYIVGTGAVAVIDPGPDDPTHLEALLGALGPGERISHILVTHAHLDHSALAPRLSARTGAPTYGFGRASDGRSPVMADLAARGLTGGGEGLDHSFAPDHRIRDGDIIAGATWSLHTLATPGHMGNHLSFIFNETGFSGDHVMAWASTLVSPPDGDMSDFMASCDRLRSAGLRRLWPGHGDPVDDPTDRIEWLMSHRRAREAEILATLGALTVPEITDRVYADTPTALLPAAQRNVFAHLVDLVGRSLVIAKPGLSFDAVFARKNPEKK